MSEARIPAVVLAGQRGPTTPLSEAANVAADVMVPVAGRPALLRVIDTLLQARGVRPSVMVGPARTILDDCEELADLMREHSVAWQQPKGDPATSSIAGVESLPTPVLITTGDHALLTPRMVDDFCARALTVDADLVFGLVPYARVREAFPNSRRTVLRFADEPCCGANLFLLKQSRGIRALEFWRDMQQHRKRPQRIARALGVGLLLSYVCRRLTLAAALEVLSAKAGCRLGVVKINDATAAVDVDSVADWHLAERILSGDLRRA
jgi:GTP:adenosylcobinamide-phosphate guanylyltransferase